MGEFTLKDPLFWVITEAEEAFGPYEDYASAYQFASINFGLGGWTISET